MTVPLLGTLSVSGFANAWFLLFFVVIAVMLVAYLLANRRNRCRRRPCAAR